jgi:hypothetical protein
VTGGGPVSDFFGALGEGWQLTGAQRAKLTPAITAALSTGWSPDALAAWTGQNTSGVKNP